MSNIYDELDARAELHDEPQAQVFPLSCGCPLADIRRVAPGVGVCRHKRVLLAPLAARFAADADFVRRGRQMNDDKNQNFFGELMRQAEAADEEQAKFAGELLRQAEQADQDRATEFVEDFVVSMLNHPAVLRSNSRKAADYSILCAAACNLETSKEEGEPWETFHFLLADADFYLFDKNHAAFRASIVKAFKVAAQRQGFSFVELAEAIRAEQNRAAIRRLRRKLGPGKRAASAIQEMSEEEAQFYR